MAKRKIKPDPVDEILDEDPLGLGLDDLMATDEEIGEGDVTKSEPLADGEYNLPRKGDDDTYVIVHRCNNCGDCFKVAIERGVRKHEADFECPTCGCN